MGDSLKLSKDKRHRSSSSLAGVVLDGTLSERKIDIKASIPEVDDQFAIAEARCEDLQDKIDLVKNLKRKRKLKKRSTTRLAEQQLSSENVPFISVRTQPKKKVMPQAARLHRLETPLNPTRGYLDPTLLEQHRIITKNNENNAEQGITRRLARVRTGRERGDGTCGQGVQITTIETQRNLSGNEDYEGYFCEPRKMPRYKRSKPLIEEMHHLKKKFLRQKSVQKMSLNKEVLRKSLTTEQAPSSADSSEENISHLSMQAGTSGQADLPQIQPPKPKSALRRFKFLLGKNTKPHNLDESVVELYNKKHSENSTNARPSPTKQNKEGVDFTADENTTENTTNTPKELATPKMSRGRKTKCKLRRHYEKPTLSSSLKQSKSRTQAGDTNRTRFPFIASKSTAPSHNIGANIQQVLNRFKVQQPLSGIPSTLAHHMGIAHEDTNVPTCSAHSMPPSQEMNSIKLGQDRLHLPTYKYRSFSRLLKMYREGNTMVRKFLRSFDDAHCSYTSMYNLVTNREEPEASTSEGRGSAQIAKKGLAEYAYLIRVYQTLRKNVNRKRNPELATVCDKLQRQLTAEEGQIRKVVEGDQSTDSDTQSDEHQDDEFYLHSTNNFNAGDGTN